MPDLRHTFGVIQWLQIKWLQIPLPEQQIRVPSSLNDSILQKWWNLGGEMMSKTTDVTADLYRQMRS